MSGARTCAGVAMLVALAWSLLIPPFQVPDEPSHFAYTEELAETGNAPRPTADPAVSEATRRALTATYFDPVKGERRNKPVWNDREQRRLEEELDRGAPTDDGGGYTATTNNPAFYYALGAIPYTVASSGDTLDRLAAVRLLSVLLAGVTVLFTFLFLRELLPSTPWAWPVGALAVAFQPLFGFLSGGFTNDAAMFAAAAALFYALARAFRHGLTPRRAVGIGAALGIGLVSKATLIAFVPAAGLALLWLAWRAPFERRRALLAIGHAAVAAALPVVIYVSLNLAVWDRPLWSGTSQFGAGVTGDTAQAGSIGQQLSYLWQSYLPRLPGMEDLAPDRFPLWNTWFQGFISRYGWLDYSFEPAWVYRSAAFVFVGLLVLAGIAIWDRRAALRGRLPELGAYLVAVAGLILVIAVAGYGARLAGQGFEQPRYLLPLLPLYGAVLALAARGAGPRLGPAAGALIVVLAIAHTVFSMLLTVGRYYG